jgi:hypothetical protein
MLRKTLAGLLLILTTLPFTAPFATIDMPTLFGTRSAATPQQTSLAPSIDDTSHALVAASARIRTRIRTILRLDTRVASGLVAVPAIARGTTFDTKATPPPDFASLTPLRI